MARMVSRLNMQKKIGNPVLGYWKGDMTLQDTTILKAKWKAKKQQQIPRRY